MAQTYNLTIAALIFLVGTAGLVSGASAEDVETTNALESLEALDDSDEERYNCLTREVWSAEKQEWCDVHFSIDPLPIELRPCDSVVEGESEDIGFYDLPKDIAISVRAGPSDPDDCPFPTRSVEIPDANDPEIVICVMPPEVEEKTTLEKVGDVAVSIIEGIGSVIADLFDFDSYNIYRSTNQTNSIDVDEDRVEPMPVPEDYDSYNIYRF